MKWNFQLRCSGRGKPWHGTRREHVYSCRDLEKAETSASEMNDDRKTPLHEECIPWIVESRRTTDWSPIEAGTQNQLGDAI